MTQKEVLILVLCLLSSLAIANQTSVVIIPAGYYYKINYTGSPVFYGELITIGDIKWLGNYKSIW